MNDALQHRLMCAADNLETLGNGAHDPTLTTTACAAYGKLIRESIEGAAYAENLKGQALFAVGVLEQAGFPKVAERLAAAAMADSTALSIPSAPLTYCGRCDEKTPTDADGKCPTCTKYKVPEDTEAVPGVRTDVDAIVRKLVNALEFYANPETYHGMAWRFDRPTGGFDRDIQYDFTHSNYDDPMPGSRARAVLAECEKAARELPSQVNSGGE